MSGNYRNDPRLNDDVEAGDDDLLEAEQDEEETVLAGIIVHE